MTDFVVDACVLTSAGHGTNQESMSSREFIERVYSGRHQVIVSRALQSEWMRHASKLALGWIASMETQGLLLHSEPNTALEDEIDRQVSSLDASNFRCAQKDSHLIKIALCFHAIIVSGEIKSRKVFCQLSMRFDALHEVRWVKPQLILSHGFLPGGQSSYPAEWSLSYSC